MKTNTPNPLVPQGTFPEARGKSYIRNVFFTIVAVHVVLFVALLTAGGCKKPPEVALVDTNVVTPTFETPPPPPVTLSNPAPVSNYVSPLPPTPPELPTLPPETRQLTQPTGGEREHTVVRNDSFYTLAKKYGVSMKAIADANPGVDSTKLQLGQKLKIPAPTATTSSGNGLTSTTATTTDANVKIHVVKSGENLTTIARAEGVTWKALRAYNNLPTTRLTVGQKLKIPPKTAAPPTPVDTSTPFTSPPTPMSTAAPAPAPTP